MSFKIAVFFFTILNFVLSKKIISVYSNLEKKYGNFTVKSITILRFCYFLEILRTFLCFHMAERNFTYYCPHFDKDLVCWLGLLKSWNVHFHLLLSWNDTVWQIWWLKQSKKIMQAKWASYAITNTNFNYWANFESFFFWRYKKLTFHPPWLSVTRKQFEVG